MSEYDASGGGVSTGDSEGSSGSEEGELYQVGDDVEELMPSTATYVDRGWWVNVDEATGMKYWYNDAEPDDIRFEFPAELEDKRAPTPHVGHEQAASPSDAAHGSGGEHEETEGGGEGVEGYEGYEGYEGAVEAQTAYGEGDGGASPPAIAGLAVGGDALESYGYHGHGETSVEASSAGVQQQGEGSFSGYYGGAWERRIDPDSGWAYYINTVTLESVWADDEYAENADAEANAWAEQEASVPAAIAYPSVSTGEDGLKATSSARQIVADAGFRGSGSLAESSAGADPTTTTESRPLLQYDKIALEVRIDTAGAMGFELTDTKDASAPAILAADPEPWSPGAGILQKGDIVWSVNNEAVAPCSCAHVQHVLRVTPRPMTVQLRRPVMHKDGKGKGWFFGADARPHRPAVVNGFRKTGLRRQTGPMENWAKVRKIGRAASSVKELVRRFETASSRDLTSASRASADRPSSLPSKASLGAISVQSEEEDDEVGAEAARLGKRTLAAAKNSKFNRSYGSRALTPNIGQESPILTAAKASRSRRTASSAKREIAQLATGLSTPSSVGSSDTPRSWARRRSRDAVESHRGFAEAPSRVRKSLSARRSCLPPSILIDLFAGPGADPGLAHRLKSAASAVADDSSRVHFPEFVKVMSEVTGVDDPFLLQQYFRAMTPSIHIDTLLSIVEHVTRGNMQETLQFAFDCCDFTGDGVIERRDFVRVLRTTAMTQAKLHGHTGGMDEATLKRLAKLYFEESHYKGGDKITFHEFEKAARRDIDSFSDSV